MHSTNVCTPECLQLHFEFEQTNSLGENKQNRTVQIENWFRHSNKLDCMRTMQVGNFISISVIKIAIEFSTESA